MKKLFLFLALVSALAVQPALAEWVRPGATEKTRSTSAAAARGTFKGVNRHVTSGSVVVKESGNTLTVTLGKDFSFDGAPDPYVALANGTRRPIALFSLLKKNKGAQSYSIRKPKGYKGASHVLIWCKQYSVTLGQASLR